MRVLIEGRGWGLFSELLIGRQHNANKREPPLQHRQSDRDTLYDGRLYAPLALPQDIVLHRRLVEQRAYRKLLTEARVELVDLLGRPGLPGAVACLLGAMRLTTSRPRLGSGEVGFGSESPGQRPGPRRVRRARGWGAGAWGENR